MKRIWFNASFILYNKTGVGAYLLTLLQCLDVQDLKYQLQRIKLPQNIKYKYFWEKIWLNTIFYIKTLLFKPDVIICPAFSMPFLKRKKTRYATVIHDLCAYRQNEMTKLSQWAMQDAIKNTINRTDIIIAVSETIKRELVTKFNITPNKITVVYNSIANHVNVSHDNLGILDKFNIQNQKYILSIATLNKRKNIPELLKAFESISDKYPDLKLLLVGGMGNEQREKLTKHPNIIFTGYIKDEDIPVLYKHALLYIFPSLYEGFGIPLIEAQFSECPVLCSDIPVFREVAGDGAEYCEPNAISIAEKMEYLINHPERMDELIKLGYKNVKRFDIEKVAQQLNEVLND